MSEALFQRLAAHGTVYAVMDAAQDLRARGLVLDSRAAYWCLFRGDLPRELEDAAPYLWKLAPANECAREFLEQRWRENWGVLLSTRVPSRELRRHLRKFLRADLPDGKRVLFRWFDPRVLRAFLPACTDLEAAEFLGPLAMVAAPGEEGAPDFVFQPKPAGELPRRPIGAAFPISEKVLRAFEEQHERRFVGEVVKLLELLKTPPLPPEVRETRVRLGLARGRDCGITSGTELTLFAAAYVRLGPRMIDDGLMRALDAAALPTLQTMLRAPPAPEDPQAWSEA